MSNKNWNSFLNVLWHLNFGFLYSMLMYSIGIFFELTFIFSPLGRSLRQYGNFLMKPMSYSKVIESQVEKDWKYYLSGIIWLPFGLFFAFMHLITILLLCLYIVSLPIALVLSANLSYLIWPVGYGFRRTVESKVVTV